MFYFQSQTCYIFRRSEWTNLHMTVKLILKSYQPVYTCSVILDYHAQPVVPAAAAGAAVVVMGSGYKTVGKPSRASVTSSRSPDPDPPGNSFFLCSLLSLRIISSSLSPSTARQKGQLREMQMKVIFRTIMLLTAVHEI